MRHSFRFVASGRLPIVASLVFAPMFSACGPAGGDEEHAVRVALVTPGPISDDGWNAIAYEGLLRIEREFGAAVRHVQAAGPSRFEGVFRDFAAAGYDLVIGHGFEFSDPARVVAAEFPETAFAVTSGDVEAPNVTSLQFAIEEPAELAGILAGHLTESGVIGVVGGVEIPPVASAFDAFERGVRSVRPGAEVAVTYIGSWEDVAAARAQAAALLARGADVLFHNADAAGLGVINAAQEKGVLAIGCNKDQASVAPDTVVASVVLDVAEAFVRVARDVVAGEHRGSIVRFDARSGIVRLAWNEALAERVPSAARAAVRAARERMTGGLVR